MSRSTILKKELPNGDHLVCIIGATKEGNQVIITFATGKNKQIDKPYDFNSSEFIKMCHAAGTIKDKEIFNSLESIGKTLWITVASDDVIKTFAHVEGIDKPFEYEKPKSELPPEKKKVIEDAREMIKAVESGTIKKTP